MTGRHTEEMDSTMDGSDLRARVVQLEQASAGARLTALEAWRQQLAVEDATRQGQWSNMKEKLDGVSSSVNEVKATLTWLNRILIGGIVLGIVGYMMRGGFNVPPL